MYGESANRTEGRLSKYPEYFFAVHDRYRLDGILQTKDAHFQDRSIKINGTKYVVVSPLQTISPQLVQAPNKLAKEKTQFQKKQIRRGETRSRRHVHGSIHPNREYSHATSF